MANNGWAKVDRVVRSLHLYTGVFLAPWMLVYAASAFLLSHGPWINKALKVTPPKWEVVREVDFVPDDGFPRVPQEQARAILRRLDLDGAHNVLPKPGANRMVIIRRSGAGNYRITWPRNRSVLIVERQTPFSLVRLTHFLHFQGGYRQPYAANVLWGIVVDAVAISMVFWVASGIYIWARRPRKRLLGGICLAAGSLLFMLLSILFCR